MTMKMLIKLIMPQPLQSVTVCWLPHCAKYCIYNINRGLVLWDCLSGDTVSLAVTVLSDDIIPSQSHT